MRIWRQLIRRKSIESMATSKESGIFKRVLDVWQLTAIGVGGIIGVGIFVLAGQQAAANAGPAVVLSFLVAGLGSVCAALCYAEFASLIPATGSAYTYAYAVLGELAAWVIGWDLLLEYALVVAVVAIGWSGYLQVLLAALGVHLPEWAQRSASSSELVAYLQQGWHWLRGTGGPPPQGLHCNVIAAAVSLGVAGLLCLRTEWGARFNTLIVAVKLLAVLVVVGVGVFYVNPANWHPFIPAREIGPDGVARYGWQGMLSGASVVFFAVFGYDTLTTAAEEAKNPARDLPRAVLLSLAVALTLYIAVALVLCGMISYRQLGGEASIADAFRTVGLPGIAVTISCAAVLGVFSVLFAFMLAAARIGFALARDGLLPAWLTKISRFGTPARPTLLLGGFTAVIAGLLPIGEVAELVNIGTLSAFVLICASVLLLRLRRPELPRRFRAPAVFLIAPVGMGFSCLLIAGLPWATFERFFWWMAIGLLVYWGYGMRHSGLAVRKGSDH